MAPGRAGSTGQKPGRSPKVNTCRWLFLWKAEPWRETHSNPAPYTLPTTRSQAQMPNRNHLSNTAQQRQEPDGHAAERKPIMTTVGVCMVGAQGKGHVHTGKCKPRWKNILLQLGAQVGGVLKSLGEPGHRDPREQTRARLSGTFDSAWQESA